MWFANRGTGTVLLVLFTMTTVLGIASTARWTSTWWPRFLTQGLHRTVGLMASILLVAHVTTAVVDEYVDIRWFRSRSPFGALYRPLYLSLLVPLPLDLTAAGRADRPFRSRLSLGAWRGVHLTSYAAWVVSVVHLAGRRHRRRPALVPGARHRVRLAWSSLAVPFGWCRSRSGPRRRAARYPAARAWSRDRRRERPAAVGPPHRTAPGHAAHQASLWTAPRRPPRGDRRGC